MTEDLLQRLEARFAASGRFRAGVREILGAGPLTPGATVRQALEEAYRRAAETHASVTESRHRLEGIQRDVVRLGRAQRRCQAALGDLESAVRAFTTRLGRLHAVSPPLRCTVSSCQPSLMVPVSDTD